MTLAIFLGLLVVFGVLVSALTEVVKKGLEKAKRQYSANFVVALISVVIGIGGTAVFYSLRGIPFTGVNIECMILMGVAVWLGSMLGYDKVMQMIEQFSKIG